MKKNDGRVGYTIRMAPELLMRLKKLRSAKLLNSNVEMSVSDIVNMLIENECTRENV